MSHRTTRQQKARALQAETGWNYMRALNEVDRRYAEERAQFAADAELLQSEGRTASAASSSPVLAEILKCSLHRPPQHPEELTGKVAPHHSLPQYHGSATGRLVVAYPSLAQVHRPADLLQT